MATPSFCPPVPEELVELDELEELEELLELAIPEELLELELVPSS